MIFRCDAEGHDLFVLAGAEQALREQRVSVVQVEYAAWIQARRFLRDAFALVTPLGYTVGKVSREGIEHHPAWDPELETLREGSDLAVAPSARGWFRWRRCWR